MSLTRALVAEADASIAVEDKRGKFSNLQRDNSSELRLGLAEAITGRLSDGHDPSRRASTLPEEHLVSVGGVWLRWSVGPFLGRIDPCAQIHARALAATSYGILRRIVFSSRAFTTNTGISLGPPVAYSKIGPPVTLISINECQRLVRYPSLTEGRVSHAAAPGGRQRSWVMQLTS